MTPTCAACCAALSSGLVLAEALALVSDPPPPPAALCLPRGDGDGAVRGPPTPAGDLGAIPHSRLSWAVAIAWDQKSSAPASAPELAGVSVCKWITLAGSRAAG